MKTNRLLRPMLAISLAMMIGFTSCADATKPAEKKQEKVEKSITITKQEVLDAQKGWGEGIVKIGNIYSDGGDYEKAAKEHIEKFYGYSMGKVLFKPTLASEKQFRTSFEGALSYFVAGNENFKEDHGFAIKPWNKVRWESIGVKTEGNMAIAMGNYFFTPTEGGDEVKAEYTFAYSKDDKGKLRIIMHGSHLPYNPEH